MKNRKRALAGTLAVTLGSILLSAQTRDFQPVTDAMLHEAVPSSLAQPLLNLGRTLDGCAASPTVTPDADPFFVETCTT